LNSSPGPLDPATRVNLLQILERFTSDDDGAGPAELAARFLPRREFARALDPQVVILRGDRGAGKTSLFRVATSSTAEQLIKAERWWAGYADAPGHPAGDTIESLAAHVEDRQLRTLWLTHLSGRIRTHDPSLPAWVPESYGASPADPRSWLSDADNDLGRIQASLDACEAALQAAGRRVTVAYDHLDRIGITNPAVRLRASSALMAIWLSLSSRFRWIRGKLFLRNDLFAAGLSRSADASKLETRSIDLAWTTQDLYRALLRRLAADEALREWVTSALGADALINDNSAGWMPPELPPVEGSISQKAVADALAGEIMGSGVKKGYTYRWIPNHLQDGNGRIVPRSMFNLVRFAAAHALQSAPRATGRQLLHHTELGVALVETSNRRVSELAEEHPIISSLEALRNRTAPFTRSEMIKALDASDRPSDVRGDELLQDLVSIGALTARRDGRVDLPDIYRYGLGVKRRGGVARPK
jgi:hypothetical protein